MDCFRLSPKGLKPFKGSLPAIPAISLFILAVRTDLVFDFLILFFESIVWDTPQIKGDCASCDQVRSNYPGLCPCSLLTIRCSFVDIMAIS